MLFLIILVIIIVLVALFNYMCSKENDGPAYVPSKLSGNLPFPIQRKINTNQEEYDNYNLFLERKLVNEINHREKCISLEQIDEMYKKLQTYANTEKQHIHSSNFDKDFWRF